MKFSFKNEKKLRTANLKQNLPVLIKKKEGNRTEISLSENVRYFYILFHFSPDIGWNVT